MTDAIQEFRDAIASAGLSPPRKVIADGRMHRFAPNGTPKDDAGWYVMHADGIPAGAFGDWRTGTQGKWRSEQTKEISAEDRRLYQQRVAAAKKQAEQDRKEREAEAARRAEVIWSKSVPAYASHPYLLAKGIGPIPPLRQYRNLLVVPVYDGDTLVSLQFIAADGAKKFLKGSRTQGCCLIMGDPGGIIVIVEGIATAASVQQATGHAIVCAFSAGNIAPVAKTIRALHPETTLVYAPDNDISRTNNHGHEVGLRGQKAAALAVKESGGVRCLPEKAGDDWNDVHQRAGIDAVRSAFAAVLDARAPMDDAPAPDTDIRDYDAPDFSSTPDPIETDHGGPEVGAPTPLGYDRGVYYYLSAATRQVTGLTPPTHNKAGLMSLAGLAHFWERSRFYGKKGVDWDAAADWLMRACEDRGVFNPSRLRGRGAWLDKDPDTGADRSIVHLGDRVFVDGEPTSLAELRSKYVYEAAVPMMDRLADPLTTTQAHELYKLCANLRWEIPVHGRLLAGWIAVAPICGALHWRPSIWITGASGSGKSWVVDEIVSKSLGETLVGVQSKTSEAGIRQTLGSDARPVLFDEAEQEDLQSRSRMQSVLDLVRQSSSEGGAEIVKGTQSQTGAKRYRIRSVFAFSSINVGIEHFADESRITRLPLVSHDVNDPEEVAKAEAHFESISKAALETITPDFPSRLVARSAGLIPIIRANSLTFASAAASHMGSRRIGDQIGVLLAGAYSLFSTKTLTFDQALEWIKKQEWTGTASEQGEQDHFLLLRHLMQSSVRVTLHSNHQGADRMFGEVVEAALSYSGEHGVSQEEARMLLKRHGMRAQTAFDEAVSGTQGRAGVWVSNKHTALTRILHDTPWRASWAQALSRIPGAIKSSKPIRISAGGVTRAVFVPLSAINEEDQ